MHAMCPLRPVLLLLTVVTGLVAPVSYVALVLGAPDRKSAGQQAPDYSSSPTCRFKMSNAASSTRRCILIERCDEACRSAVVPELRPMPHVLMSALRVCVGVASAA